MTPIPFVPRPVAIPHPDIEARMGAILDEVRLAITCACDVPTAYRLFRLVQPWREEIGVLELAALDRADQLIAED